MLKDWINDERNKMAGSGDEMRRKSEASDEIWKCGWTKRKSRYCCSCQFLKQGILYLQASVYFSILNAHCGELFVINPIGSQWTPFLCRENRSLDTHWNWNWYWSTMEQKYSARTWQKHFSHCVQTTSSFVLGTWQRSCCCRIIRKCTLRAEVSSNPALQMSVAQSLCLYLADQVLPSWKFCCAVCIR